MSNKKIQMAKKSLDKGIKFLEYAKRMLDSSDPKKCQRALFLSLCIDNYFLFGLNSDMEKLALKYGELKDGKSDKPAC